MQKTFLAKRETRGKDWDRKWYVVDAKGQTLGRLASQIAVRLMGKHKPIYTPHVDVGDNIIFINAEHIHATGTAPLNDAVRRMLPRSTLGRQMLKKLKVYAGPDHPHELQNPEKLEPTER